MKEKFESSRRKSLLISITAFVASTVIIVIGSSLISENKQKESKLEMPKIKYIDADKMEKDSFKETFGKELTSMQQKQQKTDKQIEELINMMKKRQEKEVLEKNKEEIKENKSNSILNNLDIKIPPLNEINNETTAGTDNKPPSKMEVAVENDLLIIDTSSQKDNELPSQEEQKTIKKKKKRITIPAGSFVKSILINGLDAPAGANAKSEPHPVILRVTHNANLPNKYKSDIKECRVIASGYGELSSERAIIRAENLSCIGYDGTKYESKGEAFGFITGEDGKIGLSGRVVTKQGAILARTLVAGFVEGLGKVYQDSVTTVNTSGIGITSTVDPNKATQAGIYSGIGEGAKKLSEYYLKLNDQMFSIVEINVGRRGDLLFNKTVVIEEIEDDDIEDNELKEVKNEK